MRDDGDVEDRRRIFAEIDRLRKKGMSASKAIAAMMRGCYAARMRGRKASTWARYYREHTSRRTCRANVPGAVNPAAAVSEFRIPPTENPPPTTPETTPENPPPTTPETTPEKISSSMSLILAAIKKDPRIRVDELARKCRLSKDGVKWNLRKLKGMNLIRRVGHTKGGHWEPGKVT